MDLEATELAIRCADCQNGMIPKDQDLDILSATDGRNFWKIGRQAENFTHKFVAQPFMMYISTV